MSAEKNRSGETRTALSTRVASDLLRAGTKVISIGFSNGSMLHAMNHHCDSLELTVLSRKGGAVTVLVPRHRLSTFEFPAEKKTFSLADVATVTKLA